MFQVMSNSIKHCSFLEANSRSASEKYLPFMKPEGSLHCSQKPIAGYSSYLGLRQLLKAVDAVWFDFD
jgi:hypothetical protein